MLRTRILGVFILLLGILIGYAVYATEQTPGRFSFKLGLDLNGGTRLLYDADISGVSNGEVSDALSVLKEVIERRVNLFGVSEPLVRIERSFDGGVNRVAVELPGVTDSNEAIRLIGQTPLLEFRLLAPNLPQSEEELKNKPVDDIFISTGLTGRYIKRAQVTFGNSQVGIQNEPTVLMEFNEEGKKLFAKITRENINKTLAIFLDGTPI
ncbi:MAG: protein translocase subunit SecD, partial [Patescibacteria group bacterium]